MLFVTRLERRQRRVRLDSFKAHAPRRMPYMARQRIEEAIQAHLDAADELVRTLDLYDGDADLEPSLGSQDASWESTDQRNWTAGATAAAQVDLEEGHDGAEYSWIETHGLGPLSIGSGDEDLEPSLAHTNDVDQDRARRNVGGTRYVPGSSRWHGMDQDLEAEHDGREGDDAEPEAEANVVSVDGSLFGYTPQLTELTVTEWRRETR